MTPRPPSSRLFPYTTLFRSRGREDPAGGGVRRRAQEGYVRQLGRPAGGAVPSLLRRQRPPSPGPAQLRDWKSTRLNSSHTVISYAVFCLKKKKNDQRHAVSA